MPKKTPKFVEPVLYHIEPVYDSAAAFHDVVSADDLLSGIEDLAVRSVESPDLPLNASAVLGIVEIVRERLDRASTWIDGRPS